MVVDEVWVAAESRGKRSGSLAICLVLLDVAAQAQLGAVGDEDVVEIFLKARCPYGKRVLEVGQSSWF